MQVREVMTRGAEFVAPDATVQMAATIMAENDIGAVLIGAPERLEGIVTIRDIILRVVVAGQDPARLRVRDVMSSHVFTCRDDDPAEAVLKEMTERQIRRLPVTDGQGRVAGIVVDSDLTAVRTAAGGRAD